MGLLLVPKTEQPITTGAVRPSVLPDRPVPTELVQVLVPIRQRHLAVQASVKTLGLLLVPKTEQPITTGAVRPSVLLVRPVKMEPVLVHPHVLTKVIVVGEAKTLAMAAEEPA